MSGVWEPWIPSLPVNLVVSHGGIINGNDILLFGGYENSWGTITNQVYAYDLSNSSSATWRSMDPMPISGGGITHSAYAITGHTMWVCGGYLTNPQHLPTSQCWFYTHTNHPGAQWSTPLPNLPQGNAGGALLYHEQRNTLLYTSGTERHNTGDPNTTVDKLFQLFQSYVRLIQPYPLMDDEKAGIPRTAYYGIVETKIPPSSSPSYSISVYLKTTFIIKIINNTTVEYQSYDMEIMWLIIYVYVECKKQNKNEGNGLLEFNKNKYRLKMNKLFYQIAIRKFLSTFSLSLS
jgi:Kelch motif